MPDLPTDDPDFLKAYTEAREAPKRKRALFKDGSIGAVFTAVIASEDMHTISPAYRAVIRRHADDIRSKYGAAPMRGLERRHIQQDVDASHAPDHRRKVWRWAVKWAIRNSVIFDDPTERVSLRRQVDTQLGHLRTSHSFARVGRLDHASGSSWNYCTGQEHGSATPFCSDRQMSAPTA